MKSRLSLALLMAMSIGFVATAVHAGTISLNLCPAGTTNNQDIFGTTFGSGGEAIWPVRGNYRDYQFRLNTPVGTTALFDGFTVQLSSKLNNAVSASNSLRGTLWAGPIVSNPLLSNQLTTISVSNADINASNAGGFQSLVTLAGGTPFSESITDAYSYFFLRIWAEGSGVTEGYKTKMAASTSEMMSITMTENVPIDGGIGIDTDNNGLIDGGNPYDTISAVPEIDPAGIGSVLALVGGALGLLERRRVKAA